MITNQAGGTSYEQAHLPFGTALAAESTVQNNNKRFTSYDRSVKTGLDYAINRTYDSKQGRFTQVDPIGMGASSLGAPQTLNLYAYCGNDPINYVDPSGLFWGFFKKLFKFIAKAWKWIAIAITVAVVVLSLIASHGTLTPFLAKLLGVLSKISNFVGAFAVTTEGAISVGIGTYLNLAVIGVGALASRFAQTNQDTKFKKDFYIKYGKLLNDCIKTVFVKDAKEIPKQTEANSPAIDRSQTGAQLAEQSAARGQVSEAAGLPFPTKGSNGTIGIASDTFEGVDLTLPGNDKALFENDSIVYTHELGNILSYKRTATKKSAGTFDKYGDPNGIDYGGYKDKDTGAKLEKCVFGPGS